MSDIQPTGEQDFSQAAAPTKAEWPGMWVLVFGLATSAGTLALLALANHWWPNFQIMGFYVNLIIPVGAMLVGLAAGSGYGIASWITNAKIGGKLLVVVIILQICCYALAQYQDYKEVREQVIANGAGDISFVEYFDWTTRSFAFNGKDGEPGPELGAWGYGIRLLEVIGFVFGSLILPLGMMARPYCDDCRVYKKTQKLGVLPAGIKPAKIKKKEVAATEQQDQAIQSALAAGQALLVEFKQWVATDNTDAMLACLDEHRPAAKAIEEQSARSRLTLEHCPRCQRGNVVVNLVAGQADKVQVLGAEKWATTPDTTATLCALPK